MIAVFKYLINFFPKPNRYSYAFYRSTAAKSRVVYCLNVLWNYNILQINTAFKG